MAPRTLSEKIWDAHVVHAADGEPDLLFIDLHLIHEVTSPQAFDGLRLAGRTVRRPDLTVATADHNVPTTDIGKPVADPDLGPAAACPRPEHGGVRYHVLPHGRRQSGDRSYHRARAGMDATGHDHRVRRQPHFDPRRLWCARLRHRNQRGGARVGHSDPAPGSAEDDGRDRRRRAGSERDGQGHRAAVIGAIGTGGASGT